MKRILIALLSLSTIYASAQPEGGRTAGPQAKNNLLNASFWQTKPGLTVVQEEVAKGHNPTEMNANSFDPVVMAINAEAPNESIIFLIEKGGNAVNKLTHDSRTYIFWAASRGNTEVMKYVLSKGAKTDLLDSHGASPLTFAAGGGQKNTAVYDLLIANGVDVKKDINRDGANVLLLTIGGDNDLKLTEYFQRKGLALTSTDSNGNTAFNYAARSGNMEVMKKLWAKGIKPSASAMVMASMGSRRGANSIEVFQYLESLGLKPSAVSKTGTNALHYLVRRPDQTELINYFLSKGTDVNQQDEDGNTPFMNAVAGNRSLAIIELLARSVKNYNHANKSGETALALAVQGNSSEIVAFLLNKGADVKAIDAKGNNLAYYLVQSYRPTGGRPTPGGAATEQADEFANKLNLLQAKGLNVATPQKDGNTLFHLALAKNDVALFKKIASLGVDINAKNKEGFTVLHKAAMVSKNDVLLKYLLEAGAKKDIKTEFDESAYDLAVQNDFLSKEKISVDFLK